jgi:hypothetical protein
MDSNIFVVTSVIAVTELLKRIEAKDFRGAIVIVVAALIGVFSGYLGIENLTPVSGLMVGLGAAGIMRVGQAVGRGA